MAVLRTFVSIHLPAGLRRDLRAFADLLRPHCARARWEPEDKMHLTMKFLGDTDEGLVPDVLRALGGATADVPPFTLDVSGFGAFPSLRRPRVLWVGCGDGGGSLRTLHLRIEERLAPLGFAREDREFSPHVTLARLRDDGVRTHLTSFPKNLNFEAHHALVTEIFLMKSVLQPAGSKHTVIGSSRLS